jgi:hypothetical protein
MSGGKATFRHLFGGPYYRFRIYLRRRSHQNELLIELEARYPDVFYVAAAFHTVLELDHHFSTQRVREESAFVEPLRIGRFHDDDDHQLAFTPGLMQMARASMREPLGRSVTRAELMERLGSRTLSYPFSESYFSRLEADLIAILRGKLSCRGHRRRFICS